MASFIILMNVAFYLLMYGPHFDIFAFFIIFIIIVDVLLLKMELTEMAFVTLLQVSLYVVLFILSH